MKCDANLNNNQVLTVRSVHNWAEQAIHTSEITPVQAGKIKDLITQMPTPIEEAELQNLLLVTVMENGKVITLFYNRLKPPDEFAKLYELTGAKLSTGPAELYQDAPAGEAKLLIRNSVSATSASASPAAIPSGLPPALTPPALEKPAGKLLSSGWYLITSEENKIGYLNQALYQIDGPTPAAFRLESRRFLKAALAETRPSVLSESIMFMDKDYNALRFTTTRRHGAALESLSGQIADDKLSVTAASGSETRSFSLPVTGHPTFAGAFLLWVGKQNLEAGQPLRRSIIDENSGAFQSRRDARATAAQEMKLEKGNGLISQTYLVEEQSGLMAAAHVFLPNGLLIHSDGRNYNLTISETDSVEGAALKLDGPVQWENQLPGLVSNTFSSETYGYKLTVPPYPALPVAAADGRALVLSDLTGGPAFYLFAFALSSSAATPAAAEKIYQNFWAAPFDSLHDVASTTSSLDHLPAALWQGAGRAAGRDFNFKAAVVLRGNLAYLIASRDPWPFHPAAAKKFDDLLSSLTWITSLPRDRAPKPLPPSSALSATSSTSAAPAAKP